MRIRFTVGLLVACFVLCLPLRGHAEPATRPAAPRVLILLGEEFNAEEFWQPYYALIGAGYRVEIAGAARGVIAAGSKDRNLDATATLALDQVRVDDFLGLVIPGGGAPAHLEKIPAAVTIAGDFVRAGKPTGAICHGPRLLARAGVLRGRSAAGLWKLKDEIPELWARGDAGIYVDEPVVIDGNLRTSRYPWDAPAFSLAVLRGLEAGGGLKVMNASPRVVVIDPQADRHAGWALAHGGLQGNGVSRVVLAWHQAAAASRDGRLSRESTDVLVILPGPKLGDVLSDAGVRKAIADLSAAGVPIYAVGAAAQAVSALPDAPRVVALPPEPAAALPRLVADLRAMPVVAAHPATMPANAAFIAVADGFDDRVVAAMETQLQLRGMAVVFVADVAGPVRGLAGSSVTATATYATPAPAAWVVAPGVYWPESPASERRVAWLAAAHADGKSRLVAFGHDALVLCNRPAFAGKPVATSEQLRWSFAKEAGKFVDQQAVQTDDRLITARGYSGVVAAVRLMPQPAGEKAAGEPSMPITPSPNAR